MGSEGYRPAEWVAAKRVPGFEGTRLATNAANLLRAARHKRKPDPTLILLLECLVEDYGVSMVWLAQSTGKTEQGLQAWLRFGEGADPQ